jgi:hypothetical protein
LTTKKVYAAVKLAEESQKEAVEEVCMKSLSHEQEITAKVFHVPYKVVKKTSPSAVSKVKLTCENLMVLLWVIYVTPLMPASTL